MINGKEFQSCGDSGATGTTLSKRMAEECGLKWQGSAEEMQMASSEFVVHTLGRCVTDLHIMTSTKGPLVVKRVPVWVIEQDMDELLLGDDLLRRIGINVRSMLEAKGGKTYDFETGDVELEYPYLGGEKEENLMELLEKAVQDAENRGLTKEKAANWLELLKTHVNEFRTTLAHDPMANTAKLCRTTTKRIISRHDALPIVTPYEEIAFPSIQELRAAQREEERPNGVELDEKGLWVNGRGKIWVPIQLRLHMLIISHYGLAGHKSVEGTITRLKEYMYWQGMEKDVEVFVMDCILCRCAKTVLPTRLHLGVTTRPTKPNQTVHFDYFYVDESVENLTYLLVIRDGFSRFVMIFPVEHADASTAVKCLLEWIGLFGIPKRFYSDNGPHFRNVTMKELARRLHTIHDFSTVYCAWGNGFIERILRDLKALLKILIHEHKVERTEWPQLCVNIMMALNHRPSTVLAGLAPVEVHTGLTASNTLDFYIADDGKYREVTWKPDMLEYLSKLSDVLDMVYEEVYGATGKINAKARKNVKPIAEFEIGDYVLYCFVDRPQQSKKKLFFTWVGPFQVVDTRSDYVYYIKDIVQQKVIEAHVDRLSFYSTEKLNVTGDLLDLVSREGLEYEISRFVDVVWSADKKVYVIKTVWAGFGEKEATYEPIESLLKQVPSFLLEFLNDQYLKGNKVIGKLYKKERKTILDCIKRNKFDQKSFDFVT